MGAPDTLLFHTFLLRAKFIALGEDFRIFGADGRVHYEVDGKVRFGVTFVLEDVAGNALLRAQEQLLAAYATVHLHRGQALAATVIKRQSAERVDFAIDLADGTEWMARGSFPAEDYRILRGGAGIARIRQGDGGYTIALAPGEDEPLLLAVAVAIVRQARPQPPASVGATT